MADLRDEAAGPAGSEHAAIAGGKRDEAGAPVERDDEDAPPTGPRRVLISLYAIFSLAATARAAVQIATKFDQAPLAYSLSLFSGIVYISASIGLASSRPWSRGLAWGACVSEMAGVLIIGSLSLLDPAAFPHDTVWSRFGSGYGFFPVLLPMLGLFWLWQTRPQEEQGAGHRGNDRGA